MRAMNKILGSTLLFMAPSDRGGASPGGITHGDHIRDHSAEYLPRLDASWLDSRARLGLHRQTAGVFRASCAAGTAAGK
jgi:hypothetical protein